MNESNGVPQYFDSPPVPAPEFLAERYSDKNVKSLVQAMREHQEAVDEDNLTNVSGGEMTKKLLNKLD